MPRNEHTSYRTTRSKCALGRLALITKSMLLEIFPQEPSNKLEISPWPYEQKCDVNWYNSIALRRRVSCNVSLTKMIFTVVDGASF